jgi:hypothetical protein
MCNLYKFPKAALLNIEHLGGVLPGYACSLLSLYGLDSI